MSTLRCFLSVGGSILLIAGILGSVGVFGPTPDQSIFGAWWWFSRAENWAYIISGMLLITLRFTPCFVQRTVIMILGWFWFALFFYTLFETTWFDIHFERPMDSFFPLAFGL